MVSIASVEALAMKPLQVPVSHFVLHPVSKFSILNEIEVMENFSSCSCYGTLVVIKVGLWRVTGIGDQHLPLRRKSTDTHDDNTEKR